MAYNPENELELRNFWRLPILQAHFQASPDAVFRAALQMRPPNLEETLGELALLGRYTLASHEEHDPRITHHIDSDGRITRQVENEHSDLPRYVEHVCSLQLRDPAFGRWTVAGAPTPTLAALECLVGALSLLASFSDEGIDEIDSYLANR